MPILWCLHMSLYAAVAYATCDCLQAAWGTREMQVVESNADTSSENAAEANKSWTRRLMLTSWLIVNYSIGQVVLAFSVEKQFYFYVLLFTVSVQIVITLAALSYLLAMMTWSYFKPEYGATQIADDKMVEVPTPTSTETTGSGSGSDN